MLLCHVADQLLDHHRLADARATEDADLSTLLEWADEVNHLDAGFKELGLRGEIVEWWGRAMDWQLRVRLHITRLVDRLSEHIEDAAERSCANGDRDWRAEIGCLCTTCKTVRRGHCNGANAIVAKMLLHLDHE